MAEALTGWPYKTGTNRVLLREASGGGELECEHGEGEEDENGTEGGDMTIRTVETARVGCENGFPVLEPVAEETGVVTRGTVGAADARLMASEEIISVVLDVLEDARISVV